VSPPRGVSHWLKLPAAPEGEEELRTALKSPHETLASALCFLGLGEVEAGDNLVLLVLLPLGGGENDLLLLLLLACKRSRCWRNAFVSSTHFPVDGSFTSFRQPVWLNCVCRQKVGRYMGEMTRGCVIIYK